MPSQNSVVAISGATGLLGPPVTAAFAERGARIAIAGRSQAKLDQLLDSLNLPDERRLASAVDLSDEDATCDWADQVAAKFGGIDVMLHLVGGYRANKSIAEIDTDDWDVLHILLIKTTLNSTRAFLPYLKKSDGGRFIGVTSIAAQTPTYRNAIYAMAKAASDALILAMADELKGSSTTANIIAVRAIYTAKMQAENPDKDYRKFTSAEEIAAAMRYLASQEACVINGTRLALHGRS